MSFLRLTYWVILLLIRELSIFWKRRFTYSISYSDYLNFFWLWEVAVRSSVTDDVATEEECRVRAVSYTVFIAEKLCFFSYFQSLAAVLTAKKVCFVLATWRQYWKTVVFTEINIIISQYYSGRLPSSTVFTAKKFHFVHCFYS